MLLQFIKTSNLSVTRQLLSYRQLSQLVAKQLKYSEYGEPCEVLKLVDQEIENPKDNEVIVKVLLAPINPADINIIQGKYPVKPKLPAVGGNECVGEIVCVGDKVKHLKPGDRVISVENNIGTWSSHLKFDESYFMKVSNDIGLPEAATMLVNPCTAYRMLKDFVDLKPGDTVIQNGANSAVGQAVHQLCKAWDINSVGVVRERPDVGKLSFSLKCMGASEVLTDETLRVTDIFESKLNKPKLALNCIGGKSALNLSRHLDNGGIMVTYGGMSREPVAVPTATLIFKDVTYKGFWMTRWTKQNIASPERQIMFADLTKLMEKGSFVGPAHEIIYYEDYKKAMHDALSFKGFIGKKMFISFDEVLKRNK